MSKSHAMWNRKRRGLSITRLLARPECTAVHVLVRSHDRFANTRWSMVMQQASGDSPGASRALDELAQRYWYPVYAYVRRCGHAPAIAQDITRTFLHRLITQFQRSHEQPPTGTAR